MGSSICMDKILKESQVDLLHEIWEDEKNYFYVNYPGKFIHIFYPADLKDLNKDNIKIEIYNNSCPRRKQYRKFSHLNLEELTPLIIKEIPRKLEQNLSLLK